MRPGPVLVVLLALLAAGAAGETPAELTFVLAPGEEPEYRGPPGLARLVAWTPGENATWEVEVGTDYRVVDVRVVDGAFDVARPEQLVPEYDDSPQHADADHLHPHFFQEVRYDPAEAESPARIVNYTRAEDGFTMRLGVTGPGHALLHVRRDVAPPAFELGEPADVTYRGFILTTTTDEFAYADLRIRPVDGGEEVENPTAVPALEQTFPVQGLEPGTAYAWRVVFEDWSGNVAESEPRVFVTPPEPERPKPRIVALSPEPNATLANVTALGATIDSDPPVRDDGVRLFVDKREVHEGFELAPDPVVAGRWHVVYVPPAPFAPGPHSASVEVENEAGGRAVGRWSFVVAERAEAPGPLVAALVAAGLAARLRRTFEER